MKFLKLCFLLFLVMHRGVCTYGYAHLSPAAVEVTASDLKLELQTLLRSDLPSSLVEQQELIVAETSLEPPKVGSCSVGELRLQTYAVASSFSQSSRNLGLSHLPALTSLDSLPHRKRACCFV